MRRFPSLQTLRAELTLCAILGHSPRTRLALSAPESLMSVFGWKRDLQKRNCLTQTLGFRGRRQRFRKLTLQPHTRPSAVRWDGRNEPHTSRHSGDLLVIAERAAAASRHPLRCYGFLRHGYSNAAQPTLQLDPFAGGRPNRNRYISVAAHSTREKKRPPNLRALKVLRRRPRGHHTEPRTG